MYPPFTQLTSVNDFLYNGVRILMTLIFMFYVDVGLGRWQETNRSVDNNTFM